MLSDIRSNLANLTFTILPNVAAEIWLDYNAKKVGENRAIGVRINLGFIDRIYHPHYVLIIQFTSGANLYNQITRVTVWQNHD
jgi:hypothetical protein